MSSTHKKLVSALKEFAEDASNYGPQRLKAQVLLRVLDTASASSAPPDGPGGN